MMDSDYVKRLKKKAWYEVYIAVKSGKIVKPELCEGCGEKKKLHAHHDDYYKPLEVTFLCGACHSTAHGSLHTIYNRRWAERNKDRYLPVVPEFPAEIVVPPAIKW